MEKLTKKKLYHWRVEEGLTTKEISILSGRALNTIYDHFRKHGLNKSLIELRILDYFLKMKVGEMVSRKQLMEYAGCKQVPQLKQIEDRIIIDIYVLGIYRNTKNIYVKVV